MSSPTLHAPSLRDIQKQVATLQVAERFFDSVVLFALFEVGVFRALADGPRPLAELSAVVGGDVESLRATLDAAVALKILSRSPAGYQAEPALVDSLGREGSAAYLGEWVSFLHVLAGPLLQLGAAIRSGAKPGALFEDMSGDAEPARRMTAAMDAYARSRGAEIADRLDFSDARTLLDLGCGPGTYALAILERNPQLTATLLDLAGPIAEARRLVAARGMAERVAFVVHDGSTYAPGRAFDAVLVSNTLHMIGPEGSAELLKHCHGLVNPGGRLIVQAQYLDDSRTAPRWPTLLNLIQRVATPYGRNHAIGETTQWLEAAGFVDVKHMRFSAWNVNSCLIGRRPPAAAAAARGR
jgi:3-hydroxy-5-methyl-1-naphthoate 3-O-methyltransferase